MAARLQLRRDFSTNWVLNNPILAEGELGYELDSGKLKVGDGTQAWSSLNYFQETVNYSDIVDPPRELSYFTDDVGYLLTSSPAGSITTADKSQWNSAYSWGNHAAAGYLTTSAASTTYLSIATAASNYQPADADLSAIAALSGTSGILKKTAANTWTLDTNTYLTSANAVASIVTQDIDNWNNAFTWGDHALAGYLTASTAASNYQPADADLSAIAALSGTSGILKKTAANTWTLDTNTYLSDSVAAAGIVSQDITNWNNAYGWGNHALAGYLTASTASTTYLSITAASIAYQPADADLSAIASITAPIGLLKKTASNTWTLDTNTYLTTTTASTTYLSIATASSNYQPLDADLSAIAALSGTSGILKKTAANTWTLDTNGYAKVVSPPATASSTGTAGSIAYDSDYVYICIDTNTWVRAGVSTW